MAKLIVEVPLFFAAEDYELLAEYLKGYCIELGEVTGKNPDTLSPIYSIVAKGRRSDSSMEQQRIKEDAERCIKAVTSDIDRDFIKELEIYGEDNTPME